MTDRGLRTVAAVAAVIAAMAGLLNTYQLATLTGTVAEIGRNLTAHLNAPGIHSD